MWDGSLSWRRPSCGIGWRLVSRYGRPAVEWGAGRQSHRSSESDRLGIKGGGWFWSGRIPMEGVRVVCHGVRYGFARELRRLRGGRPIDAVWGSCCL